MSAIQNSFIEECCLISSMPPSGIDGLRSMREHILNAL